MVARGGSADGASGGWEDWANLSSEILVLVIKKVQERAAEDNEEMRRVVALAGVCRGWRLTILSLLAARPFSATGLLQFPGSLREAGPMDKPVQCVMRRKGGQFFLYQSDCDSGHVQELRESKCNFLMGACKRWRPGHIMFMLSSSRTGGFSTKSAACMGKLRSNFWGTAFVLWDFQSSMTTSTNSLTNYYYPGGGRGGGGGYNSSHQQKPRPVTFVRFSEEMVNGVKKRKMTCVVRTPRVMTRGSASSSSSSTALTWCPSPMTSHQANPACFSPMMMRGKTFWKWSCMSTLNRSIRTVACGGRPRGYLSLREEIIKSRMEEQAGGESPIQSPRPRTVSGGDGLLAHNQDGYRAAARGEVKLNLRGVPGLLKNRQKVAMFTGSIPEWDVRRKCWSLDFKGRATLPSMHNFQVLMPSSGPATDGSPLASNSPTSSVCDEEKTTTATTTTKTPKKARRYPFHEGSAHQQQQQHSPAHAKQQTVVMQLGKIGKGLYALEYRSPLSAFQAFNIALSSFATTVGVEP